MISIFLLIREYLSRSSFKLKDSKLQSFKELWKFFKS